MLSYLEKRGKPIQNEEKQFLNIIKVIVDGGWVIRETDMQEILQMVHLTEDVSAMSMVIGSNDKAIKKICKEVVEFFSKAMEEF